MIEAEKQYARRDAMALDKTGNYYSRHVMAMTAEKLHAKSDIAAELAFRDAEIDRLTHECDEALAAAAAAHERANHWTAEAARYHGERNEARAECDAMANVLPGYYYMDPPDCGDVPVLEQLRRMAKDAARYRWLRGDSCPDHSRRWTLWEIRHWQAPFWMGDLRWGNLDAAIDAQIEQERSEQKEG